MKNELNVFNYDYSPWRRPFNWPRNIKQFFKNCKYAWQRATKGYSDRDIWNLDMYYTDLFHATLNRLADTSNGYPGIEPWETSEKWEEYLRKMAFLFKDSYVDPEDRDSERYEEVYSKPDEYRAFMDELTKLQLKEKDEAFDMLNKSFYHLWW